MPVADRLQHATFPAGPPNPHTPSFGRVVLAPAGQPPCEGNLGIGPCQPLGAAVAIGDMDGAGLADLVIGAPTYDETSASNPACAPGQCHESGRTYVYRGEDMIDPAQGGADPADALETPLHTLKSIVAQTDDETSSARTNSELFGQAIFPIGDVGACTSPVAAGQLCPNSTSTSTPDGIPEVVVSAFRTDLPSNADLPDPAFFDVGVNMLVDGKTASVLAIYDGRLRAQGTISDRARGVVRLQLQYVVGGQTATVKLRGQISNGRWSIDERLSQQVLQAIAQRTGTVHSYTLFTGYLPRRMRGEMQSFQVLGPR